MRPELQALITRLQLQGEYDQVINLLNCQDPNLPAYVRDCTHETHSKKSRHLFPYPNYKATPKAVIGLGILDGSGCDPFMHIDKKYDVTRPLLHAAKLIYTRSDLIAHDDYIPYLPKSATIYIVYGSNEDYPGCPSIKRREKACSKLVGLGYKATMLDESVFKSLHLAN